jgi:Rrf2 family iron-sulfur cluster assembly transcriptional regulator
MKFSTNVRYAVRVLTKLHQAKGKLPMAALAERAGISLRTMENIHAVMRENGITKGVVGARGGIELALPLSGVSLGTIVKLFDKEVDFSVCHGNKTNDCPNLQFCPRRAKWLGVSQKIQDALDNIFLDSLA